MELTNENIKRLAGSGTLIRFMESLGQEDAVDIHLRNGIRLRGGSILSYDLDSVVYMGDKSDENSVRLILMDNISSIMPINLSAKDIFPELFSLSGCYGEKDNVVRIGSNV